jgi:Exostosin family
MEPKSFMKVHIAALGEAEIFDLFISRAGYTAVGHTIVSNPADADLIILTGHINSDPERYVLRHPLYLAFPDKCTMFVEEDFFLPLIPGVHCNATMGKHSRAGRIFSYAHITRNGIYSNPFVTHQIDAEKKYLFSFQGGSTCILRKRLFNLSFNRTDVLIENTSKYYHWDLNQPGRDEQQQHYARTIAASHFVICPKGASASSIRLFEVMGAGIAPVLISDKYLLPAGVDWDSFLIRVKEKDIVRLPEILEPYRDSSQERGRRAREAFLAHFAPEVEFDHIVAFCHAALHHGPPSEATFRRQQKRIIANVRRRAKLRRISRDIALKTMRILHIKNPYQMNR